MDLNSDYNPSPFCPQNNTIVLLTQPRSSTQIQAVSGPEKAFGQALREVRTARGISQEKLALEWGFDRSYISLLERGIQSPTLRTIFRLAEALDVTPSKLVGMTEALLGKVRRSRKA